jgi:hypothetical protein
MSPPITAMAILKYQWVRVAALDRLLLGLADNRNPSLTGTLVLPITGYDISDPSFVELAFSSSALDLEGTIFVPRAEVIAILKTANPEDLQRIGYRGRASAEPVDTTAAQEPQVAADTPTPNEPHSAAMQAPDAGQSPGALLQNDQPLPENAVPM